MADMPVRPLVILSAWERVTICGVEATPSATTPLSAHNTMILRLSTLFFTLPVIPASRMAASASLPRLPGGAASEST